MDQLADRLMEALTGAMLKEISVTPKPGLVDRSPMSAHRDMDFFSFVCSSAAIAPFFRRIFLLPALYEGEEDMALFGRARELGKQAESWMLEATKGVNTQKGIIFLGGLLALSAGLLSSERLPWSEEALRRRMTELSAGFSGELERGAGQTHGEILFQRYRARGIRGEVEDGLPCVFEIGLPVLQRSLQEGNPFNQAGLEALLSIMAHCEDTTVLWRHGPRVLREVQRLAAAYLERGGIGADPQLNHLVALDRHFSRRGISPGGAADLLFLTFSLQALVTVEAPLRLETASN
ncbi:MAG: triphosphoribosyl-dephospho-CoA synthase [Bacteroidota bacterium]